MTHSGNDRWAMGNVGDQTLTLQATSACTPALTPTPTRNSGIDCNAYTDCNADEYGNSDFNFNSDCCDDSDAEAYSSSKAELSTETSPNACASPESAALKRLMVSGQSWSVQ